MPAGMSVRVGFCFFTVGKLKYTCSSAACAWTNQQWEENQRVALSMSS